jgi:hypothetical protein
VLCADRMEADGYSVRHRMKLETVSGRNGDEWGVCWGGSGGSNTVDKFTAMFRRAILSRDSFDKVAIEQDAENCLRTITADYGARVDIVVGVFGRSAPSQPLHQSLYRGDTETCCLAPEREWCCAGLDTTLTKFLMQSTYRSALDLAEAQELAVWVTAIMKVFAHGVGGPTDVAFHVGFTRRDEWIEMSRNEIDEIEQRLPADESVIHMTRYWAARPKLTS